jgi:hypothetical protein
MKLNDKCPKCGAYADLDTHRCHPFFNEILLLRARVAELEAQLRAREQRDAWKAGCVGSEKCGWCNRCSACKPADELVELQAPCGCVDRYCASCRTTPAHDSDLGGFVSRYLYMNDWLKAFGKGHIEKRGRYAGKLPCPSHWASLEREKRCSSE